jgi:hypothetical protein
VECLERLGDRVTVTTCWFFCFVGGRSWWIALGQKPDEGILKHRSPCKSCTSPRSGCGPILFSLSATLSPFSLPLVIYQIFTVVVSSVKVIAHLPYIDFFTCQRQVQNLSISKTIRLSLVSISVRKFFAFQCLQPEMF